MPLGGRVGEGERYRSKKTDEGKEKRRSHLIRVKTRGGDGLYSDSSQKANPNPCAFVKRRGGGEPGGRKVE